MKLRQLGSRMTGKPLDSHKPIIELDDPDFAIVFRSDKVEAIVPTDTLSGCNITDEVAEARAQIDGTIAYILHCLMREDWQEEFFTAVEEYLEEMPTESDREAQERQSKFRLITNSTIDKDEKK